MRQLFVMIASLLLAGALIGISTVESLRLDSATIRTLQHALAVPLAVLIAISFEDIRRGRDAARAKEAEAARAADIPRQPQPLAPWTPGNDGGDVP